ncbi:hypothetical protein GDO78_014340 [Eleutherodactylus coqui]|uniref:Uncharacterized protein n=1 Tax=Eleutherodactylus coqui TaxID=57060 RepID=A0A8J6K2Q9_ELECQ|nr:hypothetical protein GDO78_014340 [Eleutherodactylus coqui]
MRRHTLRSSFFHTDTDYEIHCVVALVLIRFMHERENSGRHTDTIRVQSMCPPPFFFLKMCRKKLGTFQRVFCDNENPLAHRENDCHTDQTWSCTWMKKHPFGVFLWTPLTIFNATVRQVSGPFHTTWKIP